MGIGMKENVEGYKSSWSTILWYTDLNKAVYLSYNCRFEATRRIRLMEGKANEQMNGGATDGGANRKREWHVPILAMTADVIHATYEECLKCGMDGYVSKPFEEENLYQAVAKFFKSKPMSAS